MTSGPSRGPGIAACIVCRNEADKLGPCLASVQWADEIVVLDLASTDGSAELARACGARVLPHAPVPIVELVRNVVAAGATTRWILALDPDERVTPGLARALRELELREDIDAVVTLRTNYDLGYAPSNPLHRYEPQIRMYRRDRVEWPTVPNALPKIAEGRLHRLPDGDDAVLIHDRSRNIPEVLERSIRYAPLQAQSMIDRGMTFTARGMLAAMWKHIHKQFVRGQAFRDGVPGVLRAALIVGFHFYVWAAFWQLSGAARTADDDRFTRRIGDGIELARRALAVAGAPARWVRRLTG